MSVVETSTRIVLTFDPANFRDRFAPAWVRAACVLSFLDFTTSLDYTRQRIELRGPPRLLGCAAEILHEIADDHGIDKADLLTESQRLALQRHWPTQEPSP